jgi:hypothetical protein
MIVLGAGIAEKTIAADDDKESLDFLNTEQKSLP